MISVAFLERVHPAQGLGPDYLTDVHLRDLGVLAPKNYVEDDLKRDSTAAGTTG